MNITIVSASPKKRFSTSLYYSRLLKFFLLGHNVKIIDLKSVRDYKNLVELLPETDSLVFAFPLYVDGIPSTLLDYLCKLQNDISDKGYNINVYAVNGCGFYEGQQCHLALDMLKNWCIRTHLNYCGGIGIGAGEMLNIIRICIPLGLVITLIEIVVHSIQLATQNNFTISNLVDNTTLLNFTIQTLVYILFSMGMFVGISRIKNHIIKKKKCQNIYTSAWFCPRFLFVIFASIYWVIRALLIHGVVPWKLFHKTYNCKKE